VSRPLFIRNVEIGRRRCDLRIEDGFVSAIDARVPGQGDEMDGNGGALIPGLVDHHIHLFALAAHADSVLLDDVTGFGELAARIQAAARTRPAGAWIRATGYHERMAGELDRHALDALAPRHKLRIQHQTGSLWILNGLALEALGAHDLPSALERGASGRPTGRLWRGDAWLRERIGGDAPPLAGVGRDLARCGVTGVTDATVGTDAAAAALLAAAHRAGDLPQRLMLMSGGPLEPPKDAAFAVGPVKILLDDHALPSFEVMIETILSARRWGRRVAVHCVTAGELAITLAAFQAAGSEVGDRIEHGGVIPAAAITQIKALGLTVVTQPAFVRERGDRYLAEVPANEHGDLYRCASLIGAGVAVAGSSDAPYASPDPWRGVATAVDRLTRGGRTLGAGERIAASRALALYLGDPASPGASQRRVRAGVLADLCLLDAPLADALRYPSAERVAATIIRGSVVWAREGLGAPARTAMTSG